MRPAELPPGAESLQFVRSSGPGGQNVNKVATAVVLRVPVEALRLSPLVKGRLRELAGGRLNRADELVIHADRFRTQGQNRDDAYERLTALIERARAVPKKRIATKPTAASRTRRREAKQHSSARKAMRRSPRLD